jgi:hypothetical protein
MMNYAASNLFTLREPVATVSVVSRQPAIDSRPLLMASRVNERRIRLAWRLHYFALKIAGERTELHAFASAVAAEDGARILAPLAEGVVAFQQWGNPVTAEWDAPDPLLVIGRVPEGSLREPAQVARPA